MCGLQLDTAELELSQSGSKAKVGSLQRSPCMLLVPGTVYVAHFNEMYMGLPAGERGAARS